MRIRVRMLARTGERDRGARAAWRIGEPYRDMPVETVRIRTGRSPGRCPRVDPLRHRPEAARQPGPDAAASGAGRGR